MKILILSHISELLGGAERSMLDVFDTWERDFGIEPEFIMRSPAKSLAGALKKRGWKYHAIDYAFWSDSQPPSRPEDIFHNNLRNTQAVLKIEDIIRRTKPDIVMTNSVVSPWAAIAAHYTQTPHAWFVREYGDLDHGRTFEIGREKTLQDVGSLSRLVIANSEALADHLKQYIDHDKVTTLYTPFRLNEFAVRAEAKVKSPFKRTSSLKLITTNNISPTKGQLSAVKAAGELVVGGHDIELAIMGSGSPDHVSEIKDVAKELGVSDSVHFTGSKPDTLPFIAHADIGIMASRQEAFGRATFECLAIGKPVVGANSGATPEMVLDGQTGYLYTPNDSHDMAQKIENYIKNPRNLQEHGLAAKKHTEEMMNGPYNTTAVYERLRGCLERSDASLQAARVINYTHKWLEYPSVAKQYVHGFQGLSLSYIAYRRMRHVAKKIYFKVRSIVARIIGR